MRFLTRHLARRSLLALATVFVGLACAAPAAMAVELTVDSLADSEGGSCTTSGGCTLREALDLVAEGEEGEEDVAGDVTIGFDVKGKIETEGEYELFFGEGVESLTILGPGREDLTIDAHDDFRVFSVSEGVVTISGLTVERGRVSGVAVNGDGGGALFQSGGTVTLEGVRFTDNSIESTRAGGAIDVEGGDLTIVDSEIDHNTTDSDFEGPGGGINLDASGSTLILRNTEVTHNSTSEGAGGGIYQDEGNLEILEGSVISDNHAENEGGGIATDATGAHTTTIAESQILENTATEGGGGIYTDNGAGGLTVTETTIAGNEAEEYGGGVHVDGPTTISASTISANKVPVEPEPSEEPALGGGITVEDDKLVLDTSTLSGNVGAAIYVHGGEAEVRASTIAANTNPNGFAGGIVGEEEVKVRSSIVAGNSGETGPGDCSADVVSGGHNIVGTLDPGCTWPVGEGDQIGVAPQLGALANNGGPTETMAPIAAASPAINRGGNPKPEDQRGKTRPVPEGEAFTDVGAVEVQAPLNETAPSISPSAGLVEGNELTCAHGSWDFDTVTDAAYAYEWLREGQPHASGSSYELTASDAGKQIACRVTADNGVSPVAATSSAVELAAGGVELDPTSHDFGNRNLGSGASAPTELRLANVGGTAVTVTSAVSSEATQFPVDAGDCTAAPLPPGEECTIEARFMPTALGAQTSTVTVHSGGGSPTAQLSGTGTAGALSVSPSSFDFGQRRSGSGPSAAQAFEVTNGGTGPVTVGTASIVAGAEFAIPADGDECATETLEPGEKCTVEVVFSPTATGAATGTLSVPSSAPTATASLAGTGTAPAFAASPVALEFGSHEVGDGETVLPVTISNPGTAPTDISSIAITGADATAFALAPSGDDCTGTELAPTETCTVEVGFEPVAAGPATASLEVGGEAPGTVALSGSGTAKPEPPKPPTPPSASIVGGGRYLGNAGGAVSVTLACTSPSGAPCPLALALNTGGTALGSWSGTLGAGTTQAVEVPLGSAARKELGAKGRLAAEAVLSVAGLAGSPLPITLVAPPAQKLVVKSARRAGDAILFKLACSGYAPRCKGKLELTPPHAPMRIAAGKVSLAKGTHSVRLPLTRAGRGLLEIEAKPELRVTSVAKDRVYQRTSTAKSRLRLG
jgi:CSLREA domain-containing protein